MWEGGQSLHSTHYIITPWTILWSHSWECVGGHGRALSKLKLKPSSSRSRYGWQTQTETKQCRELSLQLLGVLQFSRKWQKHMEHRHTGCALTKTLNAQSAQRRPEWFQHLPEQCVNAGGIHDNFSARMKDGCLGHFCINMQYVATIPKHLPCLC